MRRFFLSVCVLVAMAFAADRDLIGKYSGEWKSGASAVGGDIRFSLEPSGDAWKSELTFDLEGATVKTIMRRVTLQDGRIELIYDFDAQGTTLRSHVQGAWTGSAFK